jgi:WD40 repeat protein
VPLVVVQGGSGSGKSSLVMGGALPMLGTSDGIPQFRVVGPFAPGNAVLENLVDALNASSPDARFDRVVEAKSLRENPARLLEMLGVAVAMPALLVVDQFEEVFTLCNDRDCAIMAAAIDALLKSSPDNRVILTLREEFTNELDKLEPLRPYVAQHARFSMKEWPMAYDELKAAVEGPAALVNLHFAPGVVDDLIKSVLGQDTALPLLQFALQSLWKRRDHNRITREVYERVGSPLVALERYADGFCNGLSPENREEVKRILLELVRIDRMMEAYREPRMRRTLLETGTPRTSKMLELLAREDFLRITPTVDGDATVEVKHEALLRNWSRYVEWIGGKREGVRQRLALTEAAQRWDARGRSPNTDLLSPWQLHDAQRLTGLDQLEQDFVQASKDHADADQLARDRDKQLKYFFAACGAIALVLISGILAWGTMAQTDRDRSQVLADFARATKASYRGQIDDAFTVALQAGIEMAALPDKVRADLRPQLREVLLSTLQNATNLKRLFVKDGGIFNSVAFHPTRPDQLLAFGGSDSQIYLASLAGVGKSFPPSLKPCSDDQGVSALAFEPQGRLLVIGCRSGELSAWSTDDWHHIGSTKLSSGFIRSLSIRRDGRLVAASGGEKHVALIQLDEQGDPSTQPVKWSGGEAASGYVQSVAFSPVDDTLLAGDGDGNVLVCHADSDQSWDCEHPTGYARTENDAILTLAYSPDGRQIAIGHYWRGVVDIWDTQFSLSRRKTVYHQSPSAVYSLAFFEGCGRWQLAIGTNSGLEYSPVIEGSQEAEPVEFCAKARWAQIGDQTYGVAFDSRSGLLAAATLGGYVAVLDPANGRNSLRVRVPTANRKPIRGALLAEEGSTAWLALQSAPTEADPSNVAIFELGEVHQDDILHFAAGMGEIQRLSASKQTRRLAAIGCTRSPHANNCSPDDPYEVTIWQFPNLMGAPPKRFVSLASPDFVSPNFKGKAPLRAVLSPNGQWLVISFLKGSGPQVTGQNSPEPLFVLRLDDRGNGTWISSNLQHVREIAFSEDSKIFAAGGCCATNEAEKGVDQIQLWSVDKFGFTPKTLALPLTPFARIVQDLAFASDKDGRSMLLIGGRFGTITIWGLGPKQADELRVDTHGASFVAFSRDETLIATASSQGVVRLWDLSGWPPFELTPQADDAGVPGFLAFSANGSRLISTADQIDFWDLDPASLQGKICALLREVGPKGVDGDTPWHGDKECKKGALTPPPRSSLGRVRDFLMRGWVALRLRSGTN